MTTAGMSACGGSSNHASSSTVTVVMSHAPNSLDPAVASDSEATEADWLVYTPLLTYAHAHGVTGTRLIPGLATDLPTISGGGTTYELALRPGLVFSNGGPVRASDFTWALERAIRLGWIGSRRFILGAVVGASAFADGHARSISGIQTNDAAGQITIHLSAADGEFDDVLALPALAPVPSSTPIRDEQTSPPPGVGPYTIASVVPGRSFSLVHNSRWSQTKIPGVPAGNVDVHVRVSPDDAVNMLDVLDNRADVLDPDNEVPTSLSARLHSSGRSATKVTNATYAIAFNPTRGPFSNRLVREAVITALEGKRINRLTSGALEPGCYLLPPAMVGHPGAACPYVQAGDLARARALVRQSGWSGRTVTVAGGRLPRPSVLQTYYISLLDQIGFRARAGVGPGAQTGLVLITPPLADPATIYELLRGLDDSYIDRQLAVLATVPAGQLASVSALWMALDQYTARNGYFAVLGYPTVTELFSSRIDAGAVIYHPVAGLDWSSLALK